MISKTCLNYFKQLDSAEGQFLCKHGMNMNILLFNMNLSKST